MKKRYKAILFGVFKKNSQNFHFEFFQSFYMWKTNTVFFIFIQFLYIWGRFWSFSERLVIFMSFELLKFFIENGLLLEEFVDFIVERVLFGDSLNLLKIKSFEDIGIDLNGIIGFYLYEFIVLEFVLFSFEELGDFIRTLNEVSEMRIFDEVVLGVFVFHYEVIRWGNISLDRLWEY